MVRKVMLFSLVTLVFMVLFIGCAKKEQPAPEEVEQVAQQAPEKEVTPELPPAVANIVQEKFPEAQIAKVETEEKAGLTLFDIEFEENQGEIELTSDGQIIDITTIITIDELPQGAAEAIQKAAEGATIQRIEKAEVWAEINEAGELIKLESPKYVYEAELVKDNQKGEIAVTAEGQIVEELKWKEKEEAKEEK